MDQELYKTEPMDMNSVEGGMMDPLQQDDNISAVQVPLRRPSIICKYCSNTFVAKTGYINHLKTHPEANRFVCEHPSCRKAKLGNLQAVTRHFLVKHPEVPEEDRFKPRNVKKILKRLKRGRPPKAKARPIPSLSPPQPTPLDQSTVAESPQVPPPPGLTGFLSQVRQDVQQALEFHIIPMHKKEKIELEAKLEKVRADAQRRQNQDEIKITNLEEKIKEGEEKFEDLKKAFIEQQQSEQERIRELRLHISASEDELSKAQALNEQQRLEMLEAGQRIAALEAENRRKGEKIEKLEKENKNYVKIREQMKQILGEGPNPNKDYRQPLMASEEDKRKNDNGKNGEEN